MIEVEVEADAWTAAVPDAGAITRAAAESALRSAHPGERGDPGVFSSEGKLASEPLPGDEAAEKAWVPAFAGMSGNVVVLLTDDAAVRELNRLHRGQDKPTNVLSFPAASSAAPHLGDVALAYETCAREASEQGKTLAQHLQHLVAHAVLHLLGWDHMTDAEAEAMEARERLILAGLGAPDPYRDRDIPDHG